MSKKILAIILSAIMIFSFAGAAFASAGNNGVLQFDENGKFTIVNVCDLQDSYPISTTSAQFLKEIIAEYEPDIVILGGDNTVGPKETKADAIKEICDIFVNSETYFSLVFGNHDAEQGVDRETLFAMYKLYGGKYCLAYDADEALTGVGTHNLTVLSSDGSKAAYNLYMFDSNMYTYDENGVKLGYDCVNPDQIEWYKQTSVALKEANGGEAVPALAFQHIIVQEAFEELFFETSVSLGALSRDHDGVKYSFFPKPWNIEDGMLFEFPCPGYYNFGQLDAMAEIGDVKAIFSGHDHVNSFTVECKGIKVINTPGCTYNSYGMDINRGCRIIELDEATGSFTTQVVSIADMALKEGSSLTELGEITAVGAKFSQFFAKLVEMIVKFFNIFNF